MDIKKVTIQYLLTVVAEPKMVGNRSLLVEEVENIINAICTAAEGVQGVKVKCTKVPAKKVKKGVKIDT